MWIRDPDVGPAFHPYADPDPTFQFDADPDPTTQFFPDLDLPMLRMQLPKIIRIHNTVSFNARQLITQSDIL
jgi:hypothetical protein